MNSNDDDKSLVQESDNDEQLDDELIEKHLSATFWGDIKQSFYDARFTAPIIALLGVLLAYHLTVAPYRMNILDQTPQLGIDELVNKFHPTK